ncbi:hypothetical protein PP175_05370 [Aneurinibacillus sp. Ricciae_BoGa-3]|uniref:ABC-three component system protein n=1 Tax=Aneurinibacillus sp. Ricciae_BoGa-3 TaxID=3022697 RepID=UPI0023403B8C|nr:ABC-three component system protein [Aneurinibacillus sp. Ricciae_BoGa-3]WCK55382.1 hypothetical protein PP175_05370 [Aneurinibacillus sp. Ricciae_BoGa-3]
MWQNTKGPNSSIYNADRDIYNGCSFFGSGDVPINIDADEIKSLIDIFYNAKDDLRVMIDQRVIEGRIQSKRTKINRKNEINGMSDEYYRKVLIPKIPSFEEIEQFLGNSDNEKENEAYLYIVDSINGSLIAYKELFSDFDKALDYLMKKSIELIQQKYGRIEINKKDLIKKFIAFMYFYCDIGENDEN